MVKRFFGSGLWVIWMMYGVGVIGTCLSVTIAPEIPNRPSDLGLKIMGVAVGPAFLGATLIMHVNYLLELHSKKRAPTHPARTNVPPTREAVHS